MNTLWDYMSKQHGLNLLESEIDDILTLARQEIELPEDYEIEEGMNGDNNKIFGAKWMRAKVRNPYPKTIRFIRDDEEFFTK